MSAQRMGIATKSAVADTARVSTSANAAGCTDTPSVGGLGSTSPIEPCDSSAFPRPARRPAYSVLDLGPAETLIGPMPDWKANLADVCRRLEW
ncbi:sugar nucleotide-binding protein [Leptolyngbya sp. 15MV]|nr:sugar nucleotide-binding protein [Leptolyngbya sp. 15MV]